MKSYPSTSITRLSGEILAEAAREPVMITRYRKPEYVIMAVESYNELQRAMPAGRLVTGRIGDDTDQGDARDDALDREVLQQFADRLIGRDEAEERTGLYFSEILVRMAELGISRKPVGLYEGMPAGQVKLFDEVFRA